MNRLTQIPQVVMNIDYKLKSTRSDKNIAAYFTTCILILMQNYCITSEEQFDCRSVHVKLNTFVMTDLHGRHISLKKPFLVILLVEFCRFFIILAY